MRPGPGRGGGAATTVRSSISEESRYKEGIIVVHVHVMSHAEVS